MEVIERDDQVNNSFYDDALVLGSCTLMHSHLLCMMLWRQHHTDCVSLCRWIISPFVIFAETGGDHWDVLVLHGWKPFSRIWNPATSIWTTQLTWRRTVHSGDWCLRSALRTLSGACEKWWWWCCFRCASSSMLPLTSVLPDVLYIYICCFMIKILCALGWADTVSALDKCNLSTPKVR